MTQTGRPEKPLDETAGPLAALAGELRRLRSTQTYRALSDKTGLSIATLRMAAAGQSLPTWPVTREFAAACGGDEDAVRELWEDACAAAGRPVPDAGPPDELGRPDPRTATTVEGFVVMLKRLKTWAGEPSLAQLNKRSGGLDLPRSTVSEMLRNERRLPRLDLILAFVRACGLDEDQAAAWEQSWKVLRALEHLSRQPRSGTPLQPTPQGELPGARSVSRGLLVWMSGARPEILAWSPTDRGTYTGLGGTVLFTAALAAISAEYALHVVVGMPTTTAVLAGAVWGLIIMSLDRTLVVSVHRNRGRRNLLAIGPHLLLGLLLGAVISVPLVMRVFSPEIAVQTMQMQQADASDYMSLQNNSGIGRQIQVLLSQLEYEQTEAGKFYSQWQCQMYGRPFCSQKAHSAGPLAAAAEQGYKTATAAAGQINPKLSALRTEESAMTQDFMSVDDANTGLLARLSALNAAAGQSSVLMTMQVLLFLLFAMVECLPVIFRTVLIFGPQNTYEKILRMRELDNIRAAGGN